MFRAALGATSTGLMGGYLASVTALQVMGGSVDSSVCPLIPRGGFSERPLPLLSADRIKLSVCSLQSQASNYCLPGQNETIFSFVSFIPFLTFLSVPCSRGLWTFPCPLGYRYGKKMFCLEKSQYSWKDSGRDIIKTSQCKYDSSKTHMPL